MTGKYSLVKDELFEIADDGGPVMVALLACYQPCSQGFIYLDR